MFPPRKRLCRNCFLKLKVTLTEQLMMTDRVKTNATLNGLEKLQRSVFTIKDDLLANMME